MLTLTFLGVGSAFARRNDQSNALLEAWHASPEAQSQPDDNLLIDFGATGPRAYDRLAGEAGFEYLNRDGRPSYSAIRRIFVTHLHSDHVGGLEELAWQTLKARGAVDPPAPKPEMMLAQPLMSRLWDEVLRGGLGAMEGRTLSLDDFFTVRPVAGKKGPRDFKLLNRYACEALPTDHIRVARRHDWPSFGLGLRDTATGDTALYSSDTRFDPQGFGDWLTESIICFHEVQFEPDTPRVHTDLAELNTLPPRVKRRMVLFHYGDTWDDPKYASVNSVYKGLAVPRRRYTIFA